MTSFYKESYINSLKDLIADLYSIAKQNSVYNKIWQSFENDHNLFSHGFTEAQLQQLRQKEKQQENNKTAQRTTEFTNITNESNQGYHTDRYLEKREEEKERSMSF